MTAVGRFRPVVVGAGFSLWHAGMGSRLFEFGQKPTFRARACHLSDMLTSMPTKLFFLPGALGRMDFWIPTATLIRYPAEKVHFGWPGFGPTPADPEVKGIDDLVDKVIAALDAPSALIAQSMGGTIALRVALARPDLVTHLILAETSGGIDVTGLGAEDWRPFVRNEYPALPDWFLNYHEDLTDRLPQIIVPTLLLWGDDDPISPVKVGEKLAACLPHSELHVINGADHDLAYTHAPQVAALVDRFLDSSRKR